MQIKKAVITAAARGARLYPVADTVQKAMLPVIDRDGLTKPVIQIIAEEAFSAGVEEICIVCAPGDEKRYRKNFDNLLTSLTRDFGNRPWAKKEAEHLENLISRLHFRVQEQTLGYGHAVLTARDFVREEAFLLLLGDHLYVSDIPPKTCAQQLLELAAQTGKSISAVNATPEYLIQKYGTLTGSLISDSHKLYQVNKILEKPSLSLAELELHVPGLRMGYYLCIFGMHALQPEIFDILETQFSEGTDLQLTPALQQLAMNQSYLGLEMQGRRFDLSASLGLMEAQLALSLAGKGKEKVLTSILRILAQNQ